MNVNQWISCISEAYEITGKVFSLRKKAILLGKLPVDDINKDEVDKGIFEYGVLPKPFRVQDESQNNVIEETTEVITRYFFRKFTLGETFGLISRIKEEVRDSVEENYGLSSGLFINMAKTYWTYKIEVKDLFPKYHNLVLSQVLLKVEGEIASVFFPSPGPVVIWVRQRREMQRQLLEYYAPGIDIDAFLENNPILGTSEGAISEEVFNEKIFIRCQSPNCLHILKIPNTVKTLRATCPKCSASFRFPVNDLGWLNNLRPDVHPEPNKVEELENLRQLHDIPHEIFAMGILGSPWTTRKIQESIYAQAREKMPGASEKELLKSVFMTRALSPEPFGLGMSEEEVDEVIKSVNSLHDIVEYFIARDEEEPAFPDLFGIRARMDEILLSR